MLAGVFLLPWALGSVLHAQGAEEQGPGAIAVRELNERVGQLYRERKYGEAFSQAERALTLAEQALQPTHPDLARALSNLAALCQVRGDYWRAEQYLRRTLAIYEQTLDPDHPDIAAVLNNLATLYYATKEYDCAEPLLRRVLTIYRNAWGPEHPDVATVLNNLAALYGVTGDYHQAEQLHRQALEIRRKMLPPTHPDLAQSLNNLASVYESLGEPHRAAPLLREAVGIHEQQLGAEHLDVATSLHNLALLCLSMGDVERAVALLARAADIRERHVTLFLTTGSEEQKRAFLAMLAGEVDAAVSLHVHGAPDNPRALRLALATVLRRKGRVLDAMTDVMATVRRHLDAQGRTVLDQLTSLHARLATLALSGPQGAEEAPYHAQVRQLTEQVQQLEKALSARSAEFREQTRSVTVEEVQALIPPGAMLVEFVMYRPYDTKVRDPGQRWGRPRYVAYLIRREGEPLWVDLGEALPIDGEVTALRRAVSQPGRGEVKELARALDERLMRPIRRLLGERRLILLSPDGMLHLLPFGALVDEGRRYLIEALTFTYLTAGRDLLRLRHKQPAAGTPAIIANPAFDATGAVRLVQNVRAGSRPPASRAADLNGLRFDPLPGTDAEAKALQKILSGAAVFSGPEATESALKAMSRPSVLHVATHGFFLRATREISLQPRGEITLRPPPLAENPLVRSGLAFAGANQRSNGADDGILTALEAAGLDLRGTQLVVLSACETGVGDVLSREGVYGLRRAMVIAGAESQVMSLWKVADGATRELMTSYYRRLLAGEGRAEGLRQAQLAMLRGARWGHPAYWASFILSGDWTPLVRW
jgi:CHAT domain-containing protein/Tfp pilus assembly protein PilF